MGKRRTQRFLCFRMSSCAVVGDDEEIKVVKSFDESSTFEVEGKMPRRRRSLVPRFISRLLRSRSSEHGSQKLLQFKIRSESQPELKRFPESFSKSSDIDEEDRPSGPIFTSSASSSSSLSSSMSSSSIASSSTSPLMATEAPPDRRRRPPIPLPSKKFSPVKRKYNSTTGLFILLVSLSVLVFSGKLCAIIWTSTCLCLTPRRSSRAPLPGGTAVRRLRSNLEGEKKRIVMEGFLERNRKV